MQVSLYSRKQSQVKSERANCLMYILIIDETHAGLKHFTPIYLFFRRSVMWPWGAKPKGKSQNTIKKVFKDHR